MIVSGHDFAIKRLPFSSHTHDVFGSGNNGRRLAAHPVVSVHHNLGAASGLRTS